MTSLEGLTPEGLLVPVVLDESAPFWAACAEGELRVEHCDDCDRPRFPPSPMCAACGSIRRSWRAVSRSATVWSYAVPHPPLLSGYAAIAPYAVAIVELDEPAGVRMVGNLFERRDGELAYVDPSTVQIGEPVDVVFADRGGVCIPQWVRRSTSNEKGHP